MFGHATTEHQQPATEKPPELRRDPVVDMLPTHRPNWGLRAFVAIIVMVIAGVVLYRSLGPRTPVFEPAEEAVLPAPTPPEMSPLAKVGQWRDITLAGTPFGNLPVRELDGRVFLVAAAERGDSLGKVVADYARAMGVTPESRREILAQAEQHHRARYGRGLWPDDEILLSVPDQP